MKIPGNATKFFKYCYTLKDSLKVINSTDKILFYLLIFIVLFTSFLSVLAIKASASLVNSLTNNEIHLNDVIKHLFFWGGVLFLHDIINPLINFLQSNIADKTVYKINHDLIMKSNSLKGLEHFETIDFHNDIQIIISQSYNKPINLVVTLFGILRDLSVTFYCIILLFSIIEFYSILVLFCVIFQTKVMGDIQSQLWLESLNKSKKSRVMNYISNLFINPLYAKEIRLFPISDYLIKIYKNIFISCYNSMFKIRLKQVFLPILPSILLLISNLFVLYKTALNIKFNQLEIGAIVIILHTFTQLHYSVLSAGEQIGWLSGHLFFFQKYFEFLNKEEKNFIIENYKENNKFGSNKLEELKTVETIRFENVYFTYPGCNKTLENINFEIKKGEKIAIVGNNGSGKTTIIKLLCRFYKADLGNIYINEKSIEAYTISSLRKIISTIFQDFGNYALSIKDNIAMQENSDIAKIRDLIERVDAKFIYNYKKAEEQELGRIFGGVELSTGQWQKIAFARALYKDAELYILDEPTASLDRVSENEVYKQLSRDLKSKTAIFITHRLNYIKIADKILVLNNGRQLSFDTHDNLVNNVPLYKEMFYS